MRPLVILAMLVAAAPAARADVGIGLFVGEPTGLDVKIGIAQRSGIDLVFGWDTLRDGRDLYGHVTYLVTLLVGRGDAVLVPLRLGIGGAIYGNAPNIAVRAPLEIGLRFRRPPVGFYGEV